MAALTRGSRVWLRGFVQQPYIGLIAFLLLRDSWGSKIRYEKKIAKYPELDLIHTSCFRFHWEWHPSIFNSSNRWRRRWLLLSVNGLLATCALFCFREDQVTYYWFVNVKDFEILLTIKISPGRFLFIASYLLSCLRTLF